MRISSILYIQLVQLLADLVNLDDTLAILCLQSCRDKKVIFQPYN